MYQEGTNFLGRDGFHWWIGQVTDPKKGQWDNTLERKNAEDGKPIYSHRCRVRIVGYHGCGDELPDHKLPLAHVLLPPNMSTTGGRGSTMQYQGGEVVVGFFFDGKDAQQPVIFGTLFKQSYVKDGLTNSEFETKKQTCFVPYTPPEVRATAGDHERSDTGNGNGEGEGTGEGEGNGNESGEWNGNFVNSSDETVAETNVKHNTEFVMESSTNCGGNELAKIESSMKEFTRKIKELKQLQSNNVYVNPLYGGVIDIDSELNLASNRIQNSMTKLIRRGRSKVIEDTMDKLSKTFKDKTPKPLQPAAGDAVNKLSDTIYCNFEKIQEEMGDYLKKSLENMLGQLLDVPICAVENFLGDMFGQINNILDTTLGDMFQQLNNIQGGGILPPSKTFTKAIQFADLITGFLECDQTNCPENTTFSSKNGTRKSTPNEFDSILDKIGLNSAVDDFVKGLDDMIDAEPSAPDCNTNVLKCGPPKVDFIGGGGNGASGKAIINAVGKLIGVAITGKGSGFTEPPLLSLFDGCEKGSSAGGFVRIKDGSIDEVVITSSGSGYLPNTTETDLDGNVKQITPDPNANYDGETSYVTSLVDIVLQNTGFGYRQGDTIKVEGGGGQATAELIIEDGLVAGANVIDGGFGFTDLPDLIINSDTGSGARLKPVLKFTKVEDAAELAQISQDAVVTVIDCITK